MIDPASADALFHQCTQLSADRTRSFYARPVPGNLPWNGLGTGHILDGVRYAGFDATAGRFAVRRGLCLVLTHECDLSPENSRTVSGDMVVLPIIPFAEALRMFSTDGSDRLKTIGFINNVAAGKVSQLFWFPPWSPQLKFGGFGFLNRITHTHTSLAAGAETTYVTSLTDAGLQSLQIHIENHLFRARSDESPLARSW